MESFKIELIEKIILWYELYDQNPLHVTDYVPTISDDEDGSLAGIYNSYDYIKIDDNQWHFFHDITFSHAETAQLTLRSVYEINNSNFSPDYLFQKEALDMLLNQSLKNTLEEFIRLCNDKGVENAETMKLELFMPQEDDFNQIVDDMEERYFEHLKPFYEKYNDLIYNTSLICPMGVKFELSLNLTFVILDEVLFWAPNFNRKQNRDNFFKIVNDTKYYSLKIKSFGVREKELPISDYELSLLIKCMECASTLLLGDKGDYLHEVAAKHGVTPDLMSIYFKGITELFNLYNSLDEGPGYKKEIIDWEKVIS